MFARARVVRGTGSAREALRDAVARLARVRRALRTSDSSREWHELVNRRWSIVDLHEEEGRHYLVAVENASGPGLDILTRRELEVLAAAAAGHTNKVIAFDMGIGDSTVRVLLARSAKKLGVKKRVELVALYLASVGTAPAG
jgi:DNA-binding NarL/FixJ family response regulator